MNNEELKAALISGVPVKANIAGLGTIEFERVSAIIYRNKNGKFDISAEVLDKNKNSVCIVSPAKLKEVIK